MIIFLPEVMNYNIQKQTNKPFLPNQVWDNFSFTGFFKLFSPALPTPALKKKCIIRPYNSFNKKYFDWASLMY